MSKTLALATIVFAGVLLTALVFVNTNTASLRKTRQRQAPAGGHSGLWYDWALGLPAPQFGELHEPELAYEHEAEVAGHVAEVAQGEALNPCDFETIGYNHTLCCQNFCNRHFQVSTGQSFARSCHQPIALIGFVNEETKAQCLKDLLTGQIAKLDTCFKNCSPAPAAGAAASGAAASGAAASGAAATDAAAAGAV
jgi:hypothetical protein